MDSKPRHSRQRLTHDIKKGSERTRGAHDGFRSSELLVPVDRRRRKSDSFHIWEQHHTDDQISSRHFLFELDEDANIFIVRQATAKPLKQNEDGEGEEAEAGVSTTQEMTNKIGAQEETMERGREMNEGKQSEDEEHKQSAAVEVRTSQAFLKIRQEFWKRKREETVAAYVSDSTDSSCSGSDDCATPHSFTSFDGKTFDSDDLKVRVPKRQRQQAKALRRKLEHEIDDEREHRFRREKIRRKVSRKHKRAQICLK